MAINTHLQQKQHQSVLYCMSVDLILGWQSAMNKNDKLNGFLAKDLNCECKTETGFFFRFFSTFIVFLYNIPSKKHTVTTLSQTLTPHTYTVSFSTTSI